MSDTRSAALDEMENLDIEDFHPLVEDPIVIKVGPTIVEGSRMNIDVSTWSLHSFEIKADDYRPLRKRTIRWQSGIRKKRISQDGILM